MTDEANLNAPQEVEPLAEISPAADAAMRDLVELFSDPVVVSQARLRCSTDGPDEFDVQFESILDDQFGYGPNSNLQNLGKTPLRSWLDFQNSE
jgi:hypothetical protein